MPNKIYLLLDPVPTVKATGLAGPPCIVSGMRIRFSPYGEGLSQAKKDSPQAAKIEFTGRFLKSILQDPETHEVALGSLEGQIRFQGSDNKVIFGCDPASLRKLVAGLDGDNGDDTSDTSDDSDGDDSSDSSDESSDTSDDTSKPPARALDLVLQPPEFEGLEGANGATPQLALPDEAIQYPHLEVLAKLTIADATESDTTNNDILDVPIWRDGPPAARTNTVKVRVVDELNKPLSRVAMLFEHAGKSKSVKTNSKGVATFKSYDSEPVKVAFKSASALVNKMQPIWKPARDKDRIDWVQESDKKDKDTTTLVTLLDNKVVQVVPDKSTTATTRPQESIGPFYGAYPTDGKMRTLSVQPLVIMVRMLGEHFDVDKCFLLPKALDDIKALVKLRKEYELTDLLIVGHTDTSASDEHNLVLSLERTTAMRAYLKNDANTWLPWYKSDKQQSKRWGSTEDNHMMAKVMERNTAPSVLEYQQWHNANESQLKAKAFDSGKYETLSENGNIETARKQLILDYMNREDTTVPDDTTIEVHGCGEFFPLDVSEEHVDTHAPDNDREQRNRRVEVFLFPKEVGILPPVPGERAKKGEKEYPEWRRRSVDTDDLVVDLTTHRRLRLLGFDLEPVQAGTTCEVDANGTVYSLVADEDGAVLLSIHKDVAQCSVKWEVPANTSSGKLQIGRDGVVLLPPEALVTNDRLGNLGHLQEMLEDRVRSYQCEIGCDETGVEADIAAEVASWHDGGPKPMLVKATPNNGGTSLGMTPRGGNQEYAAKKSAGPTTTVGPRPPVQIYKNAPAIRYDKDAFGNITVMHIWAGAHAAVTFRDVGGLTLKSNNAANAVPDNDPKLWLDPDPSSNQRTIFFHGWRECGDRDNPQTTLIYAEGSAPTRLLLQVRVWTTKTDKYDNALIKLYGQLTTAKGNGLYGKSMSINSTDSGIPPYHLNVANLTYDHSVDPTKIIADVLAHGPLDHLVVNAHGWYTNPDRQATVNIGKGGFVRSNVNIWKDLAGMVRYIWFTNCWVGEDKLLFSSIAQLTQAYVSAYAFPDRGAVTVADCFEYQYQGTMSHWNGKVSSTESMARRDFFQLGRRQPIGNLTTSMDFNVVPRPGTGVPPEKS